MTLSAPAQWDVTANYQTADGTATGNADYTPNSGTLTIPTGSVTGTVTVIVSRRRARRGRRDLRPEPVQRRRRQRGGRPGTGHDHRRRPAARARRGRRHGDRGQLRHGRRGPGRDPHPRQRPPGERGLHARAGLRDPRERLPRVRRHRGPGRGRHHGTDLMRRGGRPRQRAERDLRRAALEPHERHGRRRAGRGHDRRRRSRRRPPGRTRAGPRLQRRLRPRRAGRPGVRPGLVPDRPGRLTPPTR